MNSLSTFENEQNPLLAYLSSVSNGYYLAQGVSVCILEPSLAFKITLPQNTCEILVDKNEITVLRLNNPTTIDKDQQSTYTIENIDDAKNITGLLSGVCHEFGCKSYKDADATVKLMYHYIGMNMNI